MEQTHADTRAGQAIYRKSVLRAYDWYVLGLSCRHAWKCEASMLLEHYNQYVRARHLDVGVGTGYFLDKCAFPVPTPTIHLLDLNPNSLRYAALRIARYQPVTHVADVFAVPKIEERFESIGLGFLLHCLPGDMKLKARAIANLAGLLEPGGMLFGSTILADGITHNRFGKRLLNIYNARGIFSNRTDSETTLRAALSQSFANVNIKIVGTVALFTAF